jgi:hypothetical protein
MHLNGSSYDGLSQTGGLLKKRMHSEGYEQEEAEATEEFGFFSLQSLLPPVK